MENIRRNQVVIICTGFSKTQLFPVSIVNPTGDFLKTKETWAGEKICV